MSALPLSASRTSSSAGRRSIPIMLVTRGDACVTRGDACVTRAKPFRNPCLHHPKVEGRLRFDIARDPRSLLMALVAGLKVGGIAGAQPAQRAARIIGIRREDLDDLAGALWTKAVAGALADELAVQAFYTCFPDCNPRNIYRKPMGPLMAHEWGAVRTWKDEELLSPPHELKQSLENEADINKGKPRYNIIMDAVESHDGHPLQDLGHLPEFEFDAATTEEPE